MHATDASHWGRGVVSDDREVADIRVIGGVCDRWRFSRESELLIAGMPDPVQEGEGETDGSFGMTKPRAEDETPAFSGEVPLDFIGTGWQKVDSAPWSRDEPIAVLEGRVLVWLGQHLARSTKNHDRKHLVLTDSMTATLAWAKGRSSAKGMNRICRQLAALEFATGAQLVPRWVPSEVNPADPPSKPPAQRCVLLGRGSFCAENDRPLRGANHFQLWPLTGAQQPTPQKRRSHTALLGMTKEMLICIRRIIKCLLILTLVFASLSVQSCRANWPEPLDTQPISQALVNISVMPLQSLHSRQHSRPTTEAYRTLRLQVPSTLISKAWIEEGEVGVSHPRGRPKPALHDAMLLLRPPSMFR